MPKSAATLTILLMELILLVHQVNLEFCYTNLKFAIFSLLNT